MIKTRLIGLLARGRKYIVCQVLCQWVSLLAQILAVFTLAGLLEKALARGIGGEEAWRAALIFLGVVAVRAACDRLASKASYLASADVKWTLREKIYEKLLSLGMGYRERISTAEILQLCTEGVEQLETYFGRYLPQLFYSLLAPVTLFAVLSWVSLWASLALLLCVPLIPASIVAVQKVAGRLLSKYWGIYASLGDSFLENLQGMTALKIYQADGKKAEEMDREAQEFRRITMKVLTMQLNSTSVMDIVAYGGSAVGMIVALRGFLAGSLGVKETLEIILLAAEFFLPLRLLGSYFHIAMNGMAASDKIFRLLDMEVQEGGEKAPGKNGPGEAASMQKGTVPGKMEGTEPGQGNDRAALKGEGGVDIIFQNVSFSYGEGRQILKNIDLKLERGHFTALVGESGCGKSTVAGLMAGRCGRRFTGNIRVGGVELSHIRERELMRTVTLIRHDSYLFKGTVEKNLRIGKPEASEEELWETLSRVGLSSFLRGQQGLGTAVAEKGSNFSGGQRQRLALARALLADSPVYIFDEATSNIDPESEELIMEVIRGMAKEKTILLISHRLFNVVGADQIYVMDHGKVVEHGSHGELLRKKGHYQRMYESQRMLEQYGEPRAQTERETEGRGKSVGRKIRKAGAGRKVRA